MKTKRKKKQHVPKINIESKYTERSVQNLIR